MRNSKRFREVLVYCEKQCRKNGEFVSVEFFESVGNSYRAYYVELIGTKEGWLRFTNLLEAHGLRVSELGFDSSERLFYVELLVRHGKFWSKGRYERRGE